MSRVGGRMSLGNGEKNNALACCDGGPCMAREGCVNPLVSRGPHREKMLAFDSGAIRNRKENELAYEGFLSPLALKLFAEYMHHHRFTADGTVRDPDNWQKGMPLDSYMDSLLRHVMDLWLIHRGFESEARESLKEALAGAFFNLQGYMHTIAKEELNR